MVSMKKQTEKENKNVRGGFPPYCCSSINSSHIVLLRKHMTVIVFSLDLLVSSSPRVTTGPTRCNVCVYGD
jgi:hypothetical protein